MDRDAIRKAKQNINKKLNRDVRVFLGKDVNGKKIYATEMSSHKKAQIQKKEQRNEDLKRFKDYVTENTNTIETNDSYSDDGDCNNFDGDYDFNSYNVETFEENDVSDTETFNSELEELIKVKQTDMEPILSKEDKLKLKSSNKKRLDIEHANWNKRRDYGEQVCLL